MRACGDERVAVVLGQDACSGVVAILSSEWRDTIEIGPMWERPGSCAHSHFAARLGLRAAPGCDWAAGSQGDQGIPGAKATRAYLAPRATRERRISEDAATGTRLPGRGRQPASAPTVIGSVAAPAGRYLVEVGMLIKNAVAFPANGSCTRTNDRTGDSNSNYPHLQSGDLLDAIQVATCRTPAHRRAPSSQRSRADRGSAAAFRSACVALIRLRQLTDDLERSAGWGAEGS